VCASAFVNLVRKKVFDGQVPSPLKSYNSQAWYKKGVLCACRHSASNAHYKEKSTSQEEKHSHHSDVGRATMLAAEGMPDTKNTANRTWCMAPKPHSTRPQDSCKQHCLLSLCLAQFLHQITMGSTDFEKLANALAFPDLGLTALRALRGPGSLSLGPWDTGTYTWLNFSTAKAWDQNVT